MIDPVRPISIDDIEAARKRIAGTVLRTPLVKLDLRRLADPISASSSKTSSPPTHTRSAAAPMRSLHYRTRTSARRLDHQRRQCGPGRRLRRQGVRHSLHRRRDRDRAADQARPDARARREHRAGVLRPRMGGGRDARISRASTARSSIPSTIMTSLPVTARWASRFSKTVPMSAPSSARSAAAG